MKPKVGGVGETTSTQQNNRASVKGDQGGKIIRTKERTVKEIIEKVSVWRKLYNGITMPNPDAGNRV